MPKDLTLDECENLRLSFGGRRMDNGEYRFRITAEDGSAYTLTVMPSNVEGSWQNAHYHVGLSELFIVHQGWIGIARLEPDGTRSLAIFGRHEHHVLAAGVVHNIFMPPGAVTHFVKFGDSVSNSAKADLADWWDAPADFDEWTKSLSMRVLFEQLRLDETLIARYSAPIKSSLPTFQAVVPMVA